jgi:hypothetical protein
MPPARCTGTEALRLQDLHSLPAEKMGGPFKPSFGLSGVVADPPPLCVIAKPSETCSGAGLKARNDESNLFPQPNPQCNGLRRYILPLSLTAGRAAFVLRS